MKMMKLIAGSMMILLAGCADSSTVFTLSHAGADASCPYIFIGHQGNPVVSWVEKSPGADTGLMYYAVYNADGYTFTTPRAIPSSSGVFPHAENMPKLVFKPDGSIIAMFGVEQHDPRNKYAGRVMYSQSFDHGNTWEPARALVTDTAGYDQRYFDMALLPNGEVAAIWLDNRKKTDAEGSSLYFATTTGHQGFDAGRPVSATVCQCCRTDIFVDKQGMIHLAYRDIIQDTIRDMVHQLSADTGRTFSQPVRISADNWVVKGCPHTGPTMAQDKNGLHFAWFTMGGGQGVFYSRSVDNGHTYTQKEQLSREAMAKHPQLAVSEEDKLLAVWDEPVKQQDTYNSRVVLEERINGKAQPLRYLTADSLFASYPVIGVSGRKDILVAFTQREGTKGKIVCIPVRD